MCADARVAAVASVHFSCCFRLCAFPAPATMSTEQPVPTEIPAALLPLLGALSSLLYTLQSLFHKVPGSPIILRYIKSSYQNDPWRSLLEVLLVAFALRTLLKGRTRGDEEGKNFIKLTEKVCFQDAASMILCLSGYCLFYGFFRKSTSSWTTSSPNLSSMSLPKSIRSPLKVFPSSMALMVPV